MKRIVEAVFGGSVVTFLGITFFGVEIMTEIFVLAGVVINIFLVLMAFFTKPEIRSVIFNRTIAGDLAVIGIANLCSADILSDMLILTNTFTWAQIAKPIGVAILMFTISGIFLWRSLRV
jgi:hypothetical protein